MNEAIMKVLKDRYFLRGEETWEQLAERVGGIYPPATEHIKQMKFIPSTPTLMNGNTKGQRLGGLSSCFPMGIEDSITGIFDSLRDAALVTKAAGGIGYNFSKLRSSKEEVGSLDGRKSTGPLPFIDIFNSMLDGIRQGGARRGAGMAMLDIDHPDILDFIDSKKDWQTQKFARFNISVRVSDEFYQKLDETPDAPMIVRTVKDKKEMELKDHEGKTVTYKMLWDRIIKQAHHCAEPGIFNSDIAYRQCTVTNYSTDVLANPCCLDAKTKIETNIGTKTIKELVGLENVHVISLRNGKYVPVKMIKAWKAKENAECVKVSCEDGTELISTIDHKILVSKNVYGSDFTWVEAADIQVGYCIKSPYQNIKNVIAVEVVENRDVYDIEVEAKNFDEHNFLANGLVVHNSEFSNIANSSCNLGSINLTKYVVDGKFDYETLGKDVGIYTRFLDSVIDVNQFPTEKIEETTKAIRTIGLGVMGLAHALIMMGIPYASKEAKTFTSRLIGYITLKSMKESVELAKENGTYTAFDLKTYLKANDRFFNGKEVQYTSEGYLFDLNVDELRSDIIKYGVRNSCFTSIAPTGCRTPASPIVLADGSVVTMNDIFLKNGINLKDYAD